ncbi:MAG: indolepyruvate ferredoxin oxidoreductase [Bacteroidales bacterium]|nr:MAG: indolepyruvate ferredoxin oxidoreductase [Bacteroidales bacterium]
MKKLLLLGDEAIAQGGLDAGISGIYAYPGTPSTEIMEYVQGSSEAAERNIQREWSANEKTALEASLGLAYTGKRAMVCMKHVGLNVAADPFMNSALTGVNGGLVIVVADDPSMHSSQNEQDSRYYGKFALIPVLEPSNQQEAYDMTYAGFDLSEKYKIPVMLRITTRLSHSRAGIKTKEKKREKKLVLPEDPGQFILLPTFARIRYKGLLALQPNLRKEAEESPFNVYFDGKDRSFGIIACGIAYNYVMENYPDRIIPYPLLKISQYPFPVEMIRKITETCTAVLVLEDGYPFLEEMLIGLQKKGIPVKGRLDGTIPRDGELNPNIVSDALGIGYEKGKPVPGLVTNRPPALCKGCSHADLFTALNETLRKYKPGRVFSDIGCYTLGALPPFNSINTCVDMGASVTMAIGAADAGLIPSIAVIGDSTFTHSGMTGLLDAVNKNSPVTIIISDNSTTGMTGGQKSSATGRLESICTGIGVNPAHVRVLNPLRKEHETNVAIIKEEIEYRGVSVVIAQRECIQTAARRKRKAKQK